MALVSLESVTNARNRFSEPGGRKNLSVTSNLPVTVTPSPQCWRGLHRCVTSVTGRYYRFLITPPPSVTNVTPPFRGRNGVTGRLGDGHG